MFSFILMGFIGRYFAGLIISVILMDLGIQIAHVSNQTRIYSLDPLARGRLNMVYMFCYFVGGALGSYLGAVCWHHGGWWGVCSFCAAILWLATLAESFYNRSLGRSIRH
jgi:predicted MFS family arabinose efflux permease